MLIESEVQPEENQVAEQQNQISDAFRQNVLAAIPFLNSCIKAKYGLSKFDFKKDLGQCAASITGGALAMMYINYSKSKDYNTEEAVIMTGQMLLGMTAAKIAFNLLYECGTYTSKMLYKYSNICMNDQNEAEINDANETARLNIDAEAANNDQENSNVVVTIPSQRAY